MTSKIICSDWSQIKNSILAIDSDQLFFIVDQNIPQLDLKFVPEQAKVYKLKGGEQCKDFHHYELVLNFLLSHQAHRYCHLVAIGGGTISDLVGLVASTLNRGVAWSVVPTTLLAMVDAAIGGKTGINSSHGKNLIGSFHLPQNIWISSHFLKTLPQDEIKSGLGEVFKYSFISRDIGKRIDERNEISDELILCCANFKEKIIQEDYREGHKRKWLNLGHTFGHALERLYSIPHGVAVVLGTLMIIELYCDDDLKKIARERVDKMSFDFSFIDWSRCSARVLFNDVLQDKKRISSAFIELIVPQTNGYVAIKNKSLEHLESDLKALEKKGFDDLTLR